MLRCADGAYYIGSYRGDDLMVRVHEHNLGYRKKAWTYKRR
ncbi:MAG: GIY-YIG nuclease family protein, partial [Pseudomonadota bacterium]